MHAAAMKPSYLTADLV